MSNIDRKSTVRGIIGLLLLAGTVSAWAITTPEPAEGRGQLGRMVDARVNLKDSFQRATDARPGAASAGRALLASRVPAIASAISTRAVTQPGLEVRLSNLTGGPRSILNKRGALTGPAPGRSSEAIVRGYLQQNADMFGLSAADLADLVVLGDSAGGTSGLRMLRIEQQINGRPVFQSETRFLLDRDGRLIKGVGLMIPNARELAAAANAATFMTPEVAVSRLLAAEGKTVDPATYTVVSGSGGRFELSGSDGYITGLVTARQVLFPLAPGLLVPAWSLVAFTTGEQDWYAIVDAETGDLLWRKGIRDYASAHDARFRVYVQADGTTPADNPAPQSPNTVAPGAGTQFTEIAPTVVSMHAAMLAADPTGTASPNGWIDDCPGGVCTANETQTLGNNVLACLDRLAGVNANICDTDAAGVLDGNGRPTGNPDINARDRDFLGTTPRDFETGYLPAPQAGNPEAGQTATGAGANGTTAFDQFRRGAVTHLFYLTNWYHDKLYRLGFDEASGNFQQTNFSGFGLGNDRVRADAQDGGGTNNANFSTPPDGISGRMQMYRFTFPTIDRDGGLDAEIVLHELTHGTSNRLVGNGAGLNWDPASGLGEGWSDFFALSLLNNTNADDPNGRYASGAYATYKFGGLLDNYVYGIRRFPYSTDHSVNPMTWADVDDVTNNLSGGIPTSPINFNGGGAMEVHNSGEIWALTLWGVRARVIADPAGANGDVPTGNHAMLQLVTDGLKMTPIDPTFIEARDAIIQADCATNTCANEGSIWSGFADRGLGYGSRTPYNVSFGYVAGHMGVRESFSVPFLDVVNVATDVTIIDGAPNNNNGMIDPGEAIKITVKLTNPWRAAGKAIASATATLTTSTPGVTIYDNSATYGAIAPQETATGDTFMFTVAPGVPCGSAIDFTLTTVSSLGTTATTFQLRVGGASGTDPVVTYTGTPGPALAIPDNSPRGVFHQIDITDDFVIADIDLRLDSATHTFTGDLTAMLRSPGGVGVDLISLIGGLIDGGPGDNITNMVIDDDVAVIAANDMVQAVAAAAPYTKSWLPVFNSPWGPLAGFPATDPIGNLSRHDGTSTKGIWTLLVSDQFATFTGTLNSWSLHVTPVHFACIAVVPAVEVMATKTVTGSFDAGQTVTYTVTLTNTGTASQDDNPGNEFTDLLPSSLTLVNASATSGIAVATFATNTVTWNGSLAPLGGSVTITITATINASTPGDTVVSNQGGVLFDADANGVNETARFTDDPAVGGANDPTVFTVTGTPAIALSTPSVVFASRLVGSPSPVKTVTVTNIGTANLVLAAITVSGANPTDFTTSGTCTGATVLAPAAACSINVTFTPGGLGARSASLDVLSNDPVYPTKSASLSGTGVATAPLFRSYLAPTGSDANPCTLPAPCRLLPAALDAVAEGGEIWLLGSANFNVGTVNISKSVTILAVPGALGSVVANNADAIQIGGSVIDVTLRNLVVLNLSGAGNTGIRFNQGSQLTVEGCEIYGVGTGILAVAPGGLLSVKDSTIRDAASTGIDLQGGVLASVDRVALLNNASMGINVSGGANATVSNSTISGNTTGANVAAASGTTARLTLSATELSGNSNAVAVSTTAVGDTAHVVLEDVTITHNGTGIALTGAGNTAVFSRMNNTLRFNTIDVTGGTLTPQGGL